MTIRKSHSRKIKAKGGGFKRVTVKSAFVIDGIINPLSDKLSDRV